jgi:DNA-binding NarL/FixJ family response regulator
MNLAEDIPVLGTRPNGGAVMDKIKVLVADDHPTFRQGLCHFLSEESDIDIVAQADNGEGAINLSQKFIPNVAIIDVSMPGLNGIEAARQIKGTCPSVAILMISAYDYESYFFASLQVGAAGFVLKNMPVGDLVRAVRMVNSGAAVFDFNTLDRYVKTSMKDNQTDRIPELCPRQLQVLEAAGKGLSNHLIAERLGIGPRTVQTHMSHILRKFKAHSRTEAVLQALKMGYLNPDGSNLDKKLSIVK